jgi:hypothetical protein
VPALDEDRRQDQDLEALDGWIADGSAAAAAGVGEF